MISTLQNRILIVEDEYFMREVTRSVLQRNDYKTFEAKNGMEGVALAFKVLPDLILCDIEMPQMNGLDFYNILQSNDQTAGIPFIFLTARSTGSDIRAGMQLGVDDYITKPFDSEELLTAIEVRIKKSQRIIKNNEHNLQLILNSKISGVFILKNSRFTFVNHTFENISGHNADELLDRKFQDIVVNKDKAFVAAKLEKCENGRIHNCQMNVHLAGTNGAVIPVALFSSKTTFKGVDAVLGTIRNANVSAETDPAINASGHSGNIEQLVEFIISHKQELSADQARRLKEVFPATHPNKTSEYLIIEGLSKREREVLARICKGNKTHEIADALFISPRTVERHRANMLSKTETKNTPELILYALKNGIVQIEDI